MSSVDEIVKKTNIHFRPGQRQKYGEIMKNIFCNNVVGNKDTLTKDPFVCHVYGLYLEIMEKNYVEMKKYYVKAIELGFVDSMYRLGYHCEHVEKNYDMMKMCYLMAIDRKCLNAMYQLGYYHYLIDKDYDLMKKYYLMAIALNHSGAMNDLALYYGHVEKDYEMMRKYFMMAIDRKNALAMYNFGYYYKEMENNYDMMKYYYLKAIELKQVNAMYDLADYYDSMEKNYSLMKEYYLMAINHGHEISFEILLNKCDFNLLALYKLLMEVPEDSRSDYLKAKLALLEEDKAIKSFSNKIRMFKRLNNYNQCPICLEENILQVNLECGHELCINCYDPDRKCHYRC